MRFYYFVLWLLCTKGYICEIIAKATNIVCLPNEKYVVEAKCSIKAKSWEKAVIQMDCFLKRALRNPTMHVQIFKKDYSNQFQPFLVNISFALCDVISRRKFLHYSNEVWKTLKKYTNANHSCPFSGPMFARDLDVNLISFPPTTPLGLYLATFDIIEQFSDGVKESFGSVKFYFEIMQKKERRRNPKKN